MTLFAEKMTAGKGFIALAVVTFGGGSLWKVMAISGLFGLADAGIRGPETVRLPILPDPDDSVSGGCGVCGLRPCGQIFPGAEAAVFIGGFIWNDMIC